MSIETRTRYSLLSGRLRVVDRRYYMHCKQLDGSHEPVAVHLTEFVVKTVPAPNHRLAPVVLQPADTCCLQPGPMKFSSVSGVQATRKIL
jgi:hypothetical protein